MKKDLKQLPIRCMYDHIITTMEVNMTSPSGIILKANEKGEVKTRQTVLVAGPNSNVVPGDEIELYVERFPKVKREDDKYTKNGIGKDNFDTVIPTEYIDGEPYLFISSREVKYIYVKPEVIVEPTVTVESKVNYITKDKPC